MSDLHESAHGVSKHVTLGFVLGWIFAAAFAILALVALFQPGQFMTGVFLILAALVALPPAHTFIKKKANVSISGVFRTALAIIFYFLSIAMLASVKDAASKGCADGPCIDSIRATSRRATTIHWRHCISSHSMGIK